ncbi:MAG: V-type ATP synthase subunit E family protein [Candidatus Omnitrophota bacterium]
MALEDILKKIEVDAETKIQATLGEAKAKETQILAAAKSDADKLARQIIDDANALAERERTRILSEASMKARLLVLSEKQALIEEVFDRALAALINMDDTSYEKFIKAIMSKVKKGPDEELIKVDRKSGGGIILQGDKVRVDMTFPKIVEQLKPELIGETAKILFG